MNARRNNLPDALPGRLDVPESEPAGADDWLMWQLADSAFPTGGFAHSGGLEAAWQHGELRGPAELATFIEASLHQCGHGSLPFMTSAHTKPGRFTELDRWCDSFLTNHVANRASRLQGQALLASAERIFPTVDLGSWREAEAGGVRNVGPPLPGPLLPRREERESKDAGPAATVDRMCHLAPVFGVVTRSLGVGREAASRLFFFLHLRGLIAGAVRLGVAGPLEAQGLQHRLGARAEAVLERCRALAVEDAAQTAPLLEIWQGAQDRLYSRLFQS